MKDFEADNKRLRRELWISIAEREVAQTAIIEIASGEVADPKERADRALSEGAGVRARIEARS